MVTVSQTVLVFLILVLLKKIGAVDIFQMLPNKFIFIPVFLIWLFLVFKYYSHTIATEVVQLFEQKPLKVRRTWGYVNDSLFYSAYRAYCLASKKVITREYK